MVSHAKSRKHTAAAERSRSFSIREYMETGDGGAAVSSSPTQTPVARSTVAAVYEAKQTK